MKIAIIGTGNVGRALGTRWAENGHDIHFGVRDLESPNVEKTRAEVEGRPGEVTFSSVREATTNGEVVVLATPWPNTREAVRAAGSLGDRILVDCTNPIGESPGEFDSAAEQIAEWAEGGRLVKAFNTTGAGNMVDPAYADGPLTMFVCGSDRGAKETVSRLAREIGFHVEDAGSLGAARHLEHLALFWIHLAYEEGRGPDIGFRLLSR